MYNTNSKFVTNQKPHPLNGVGFLFERVQSIKLIVESTSYRSNGPRSIWNRKWHPQFTPEVSTNNAKPRWVGFQGTLVNSISRGNHSAKRVWIVIESVDTSLDNQNSSKTWKTWTKWSCEPGRKYPTGVINAKPNRSDNTIYGVKTLFFHLLCQFEPLIDETNPGSITTQNEKVKTIVQREYT
jgi:hypothetical protein